MISIWIRRVLAIGCGLVGLGLLNTLGNPWGPVVALGGLGAASWLWWSALKSARALVKWERSEQERTGER